MCVSDVFLMFSQRVLNMFLQVMDLDYREAMEEMFPGTWSRREAEI